jgi:hypothetical protein
MRSPIIRRYPRSLFLAAAAFACLQVPTRSFSREEAAVRPALRATELQALPPGAALDGESQSAADRGFKGNGVQITVVPATGRDFAEAVQMVVSAKTTQAWNAQAKGLQYQADCQRRGRPAHL